MSRPAAEHSSLDSLSVPGKVFLLGEYAVLEKNPALVLTVEPSFRLVEDSSNPTDFHPESPAGRLLTWSRKSGKTTSEKLPYRFEDPYHGIGGLGASTAQFALLYSAIFGKSEDWQTPWRLYRELMMDTNTTPPSGADLVAQLNGGVVWTNPEKGMCESLEMHWGDRGKLIILGATRQAGRKVETHKHLQELSPERLCTVAEKAAPIALEGATALKDGNWRKFASCLNRYADLLCTYSLETQATFEDRQAFSKVLGVCGIKGSGSLQSDSLVLIAEAEAVPSVLKLAEERNLFVISGNSL